MIDQNNRVILAAIQDFHQARRHAAMQEILARVTGSSAELLSFDDVRRKLKASGGLSRGLRDIPLDAIVGSVGRYKDFTRSFLPKLEADQNRWARVMAATTDPTGVPPIEVYQIGQAYFVLDGNHRVSVARQLGNKYIQAYVTEFRSKVPLSPDDQPEDLALKAEYADFLERTHLDHLRPAANLQLTEPGRYWELETQIAAVHFMMGQELGQPVPDQEAVCHWYDRIYLATVQVIRERGIMQDFPNRTETDLYLWIFRHRTELEKRLGWQIDTEAAATDFATEYGSSTHRIVSRVEEKLLDAVAPAPLETGPTPGEWRQQRISGRVRDRLFSNILVPLGGTAESWIAFDQAVHIARREQSRLYGLHVVPTTDDVESEVATGLQAAFEQRCEEAGISGSLSIEVGNIARTISDRARWVDLVVLHLAHPPGERVLSKLGSGFRTIVWRCPRPVLTVTRPAASPKRIMLAYDSSPKAREGLFVATYLARQWRIPLVVLTVIAGNENVEEIAGAQKHLEKRGVSATYVSTRGAVAETILTTVGEYSCDLIIMGGYGHQPILEAILGSAVDLVLRKSQWPTLICR